MCTDTVPSQLLGRVLWMEHVQPAVLNLIFAFLKDLDDFVRCSLVCKSWAAAISQARPKRLNLLNLPGNCQNDGAGQVLRRLRAWHRRQGLQQVEHLFLKDVQANDQFCPEDSMPTFTFSQALFSLIVSGSYKPASFKAPFASSQL